MSRNAGSRVYVQACTVVDRDGQTYALEVCEVVDGSLFHARRVERNDLFDYHERWVLPAPGWTVNRFHWLGPPHFDWYIETDFISVEQDSWTVADGFIDVRVFENLRYQVEDADELAAALADGTLTVLETTLVLGAFDRLHRTLVANGFSGAGLIRQFCPGLAHHL